MSARTDDGALPASVSGRLGVNDPRNVSTTRADARNDQESRKKGSDAATPNSAAPIGGPTNSLAIVWVTNSREFARSSTSSVTTLGRIASDAVSKNTSPHPSRNAVIHNSAI